MIAICPHCQKKLKIGPKIESSLRMLSPGKSLRINCPQCGDAILLDANSMLTDAQAPVKTADSPTPRPTNQQVKPPPPPDLSGLSNNAYEGKGTIEDIPKVLVLMPDSPNCRLITETMEALGYQLSFVQSAEEAMEKMQFVNYASVILHSHYEGSALENGLFHQFMRAMNMSKRRYIFYILIGPEFHTLYGMEALACSANLVINDQDLPQLAIILRTAIPQHEGMFGAIMQEMNVLGR
jgi:CheY-like chemotaxis protein